jgi:hypothetical protein
MKKKGVLQLALRLNFRIALDTCKSPYLYVVSVIGQVAKAAELQELQLIVYTVQLITTQLQLCHNNSLSTTMLLPYDYNHNVMLTSFSIHPSKFNTSHYEDFL